MKKGIDVSYAQGNINFSKINKDDVQFAVIRSSFGWQGNQKDNQFERNYTNFKKLGIPIGAYHYSYAKNAEEGKKEAQYCLSCIKGKTFELPVYYDMEEAACAAAGRRNCTNAAIAFCEEMKKAGYRVGIYTNPSWLENYLYKNELIGKYSIWLAAWGASYPRYECDLWQYNVGNRYPIDGYGGEIDLDYMVNENILSPEKPTPEPTPTPTTKVPDIYYQVYTEGRWLPYVKNLNGYAGLENKVISGVRCKVTKGHIKYRVKLLGGDWLPWVKDTEDYAGILGKPIDCIQMEFTGLTGYKIKYRVSSTRSKNYFPWVYNWNKTNSDGYAGVSGLTVDKMQAQIVKK